MSRNKADLPKRQCDVCRKRALKSQLLRWVNQKGVLVIDLEQRLPGRGYYSCSKACAEILRKRTKRKP